MFYEFSLGPIPWLYMAETMTDKGLSVGVLVNWLFTLLVALITPYCVSGEYFIVLGVLCALSGVFCLLVIKETKNLTEAEVANLYNKDSNKKEYNVLENSS